MYVFLPPFPIFYLSFFPHITGANNFFRRKGNAIMMNAVRKMEGKVTKMISALDEFDRKTDLSTGLLQKMSLYDEDNELDQYEDGEDLHFGFVRLVLMMVSAPIFITAVSSLLILFE